MTAMHRVVRGRPGDVGARAISRRELLRSTVLLGTAGALAACDSRSDGDVSSPATASTPPRLPVDVPDPVDFVVTRWRADPLARGSYSFLARGAAQEDRSSIAAPVDDRLFFAGEATHRVYPATVHGALMSGRRVAGEVVDSGATSVVIVGAGAAGLEAASRLSAAGLAVTVVEGRDRIGGRVWTDESLGAPLDLGASWIHGVSGNPLTEIADAAAIDRAPTDYDNRVIRDSNGPVAPSDVPSELEVVFGVEQEYGADVDALSPEAVEEGGEYSGGDVVFPGGYAALIDELYAGPVELGVTVDTIERGADAVRVRSTAGDFEADAVVVTVPLGVLQARAIDFDPPLPADKLAAIDRLGMGLLDKVCLRFDEVFWDTEVEFIGHVGSSRDRFVTWFNIAAYTGEPILMAFNAAGAADMIEAATDEAIVAEAMASLRDMYGAG